jgi:hypothetical protein
MRIVAMREASRPSEGGVTASGGDLTVLSVGWGADAEMWCHTLE